MRRSSHKEDSIMKKLKFSVMGIQHGHIYGMCADLIKAGGELVSAYDKDEAARAEFAKRYPDVKIASSENEILEDQSVSLVTGAAITSERADIGIRVMKSGKDYFVDKGPFTTLSQLEEVKKVIAETGRKYMVCYSERLQSEASELAGIYLKEGRIGKVLQYIGMGPHRLSAPARPEWFFKKEQYGGIISDICSHQFEQFLYFTGETDAKVNFARVSNFAHPEYPEFEDFGEVSLTGVGGTSGYMKVDWFTPDGLASWGDVRCFIIGTDGFMELRKNLDITGAKPGGDHIFITTNGKPTEYINATDKIGHPFFEAFIDDCINRTENAMTQAHCLKAAELTLLAQDFADKNK